MFDLCIHVYKCALSLDRLVFLANLEKLNNHNNKKYLKNQFTIVIIYYCKYLKYFIYNCMYLFLCQ